MTCQMLLLFLKASGKVRSKVRRVENLVIWFGRQKKPIAVDFAFVLSFIICEVVSCFDLI